MSTSAKCPASGRQPLRCLAARMRLSRGWVGLSNSRASLTMRQAGYCALRRSSPFQFWWIWRGKSRPRCSPQCIPVTRRRRFFFRKTGGVEETLGESLPLRQLPDRYQKAQQNMAFCRPRDGVCSSVVSHRCGSLTPSGWVLPGHSRRCNEDPSYHPVTST